MRCIADREPDLGEVIDRSWINGRRENLSIFGSQGIQEIVSGFLNAYNLEYGYRTAHHGPEMMPPQYSGAQAYEFQAPSNDQPILVYDQNGVVVKAFKDNHPSVTPAVGYRSECAGKVVVILGGPTRTAVLLE